MNEYEDYSTYLLKCQEAKVTTNVPASVRAISYAGSDQLSATDSLVASQNIMVTSIDEESLLTAVGDSQLSAEDGSNAQADQFKAVLENMAQGVCLFDRQQRLIISNQRFAEIYRLKPEHITPGTTLHAIVEQRYLAGSTPAMTQAEYLSWRDEIASNNQPHDSVLELQNGCVVAIRHQPMQNGGWVSTHEDITERQKAERKLAFLARHDAVTGLINRTTFAERLQNMLGHSSNMASCAVLALSLNGFSAVNATLGRPLGDELLRLISDRLRQHLGPADLLGQQGANAFLIVRCGAAQPAEASRFAERLLSLLEEPVVLNGQPLVVSASIGIAVTVTPGSNADTLIQNASIAMHRARTEGRGHFRLFESEMDSLMQTRRLMEIDLRDAVSRMAFELYYQPQIDIRTRRVKGFEALLRWNHPTRGAVSPATFIPLAEELGLIGRIGKWVLEQACIAASSWPDRINVAVNVSALQFSDEALPSIVTDVLCRSGLLPSRLELEITETCMVENASAAAIMLTRLRGIGVRVAMDDFGTGYSSLGSLPNLPFDKIKIDRSFVDRLGAGPEHTAIIRAIISLCVSLGVVCNAEGVETEQQLALLTSEGCMEVQGYLLGQACPAEDVPALLELVDPRNTNHTKSALATRPRVPLLSANQMGISFAQIAETANDIIIVTAADLDPPGPTILYVNPAFTRLTGYEAHEVLGRSPRILQGPGTDRTTLSDISAALRAGREVHQKVLNFAKCGAPYWLDLRIVPLRDVMGKIVQFVAVERDVTLDKRRLDELEYVSDRDTLTGIPNRRALLRTLDAELQTARSRGGARPCLAWIDVDHFKRVNDEFGHATGDAVLFGIADCLAENVRRMDMVGRIGGEEFAVCMPSITLLEAAAIAERLRQAVNAKLFDTPVGPLRVTVSVGVSEAQPDEHDLSELMGRADRAMYVAKRAGRNQVVTEPDVRATSGGGMAERRAC